jgi:hypothetical protein
LRGCTPHYCGVYVALRGVSRTIAGCTTQCGVYPALRSVPRTDCGTYAAILRGVPVHPALLRSASPIIMGCSPHCGVQPALLRSVRRAECTPQRTIAGFTLHCGEYPALWGCTPHYCGVYPIPYNLLYCGLYRALLRGVRHTTAARTTHGGVYPALVRVVTRTIARCTHAHCIIAKCTPHYYGVCPALRRVPRAIAGRTP